MTAVMTDKIQKEIVLNASRTKVWRALTDVKQFTEWFGCRLDGDFQEGRTLRGNVAAKGYEHFKLEVKVEKIQPETYFAYRWHPYPSDPTRDYSDEPMTLVEFRLHEVKEGVRLVVVESGFEGVAAERRAEAFKMNEGGWAGQLKNIAKYVAR